MKLYMNKNLAGKICVDPSHLCHLRAHPISIA